MRDVLDGYEGTGGSEVTGIWLVKRLPWKPVFVWRGAADIADMLAVPEYP
jgi:hypothetical protein